MQDSIVRVRRSSDGFSTSSSTMESGAGLSQKDISGEEQRSSSPRPGSGDFVVATCIYSSNRFYTWNVDWNGYARPSGYRCEEYTYRIDDPLTYGPGGTTDATAQSLQF